MADLKIKQIYSAQKIGLVAFGLLLVLAITLASNSKLFGFDISYLARDELSGNLLPAQRNIVELSAKFLLVLWLAVETTLAALLFRSKGFKEAIERDKINRVRWAAWGISGYFALVIVGALIGIRDLAVLKPLGFLVLVSGLLGWTNEWVQAHDKKKHWLVYGIAAVSGILPWLTLSAYLALTWVFGMITSPWHSMVVVGSGLIASILVAWQQGAQIKNKTGNKSKSSSELNLVLVGVASKIIIALALIIGLKG